MRFRVVVAGSDAVAIGRRACQLLDQGHSKPDVVNSMIQHNARFSTDAATTFTQIAESSYCPQYIGERRHPPSPRRSPTTRRPNSRYRRYPELYSQTAAMNGGE